jgi:hypothetical protein
LTNPYQEEGPDVRLTSRFFHLIALALLLVGATIAVAGPSGAIFTTNVDGTFVNGNVYDAPEHVYLNGGPRPNAKCTAAGLPDGVYVFQVTDPSGGTLLSTDDPVDRLVRVSGGVLVVDPLELPPLTVHATSPVAGPCGGVTVQLAPFAPTPNPGGEYKVWMTPLDSFNTFGGFVHSQSKTDNFKVVPPDTTPD